MCPRHDDRNLLMFPVVLVCVYGCAYDRVQFNLPRQPRFLSYISTISTRNESDSSYGHHSCWTNCCPYWRDDYWVYQDICWPPTYDDDGCCLWRCYSTSLCYTAQHVISGKYILRAILCWRHLG